MASENVGRVVQIIGPVVDVEFEETIPPIYQALHIKDDGGDGGVAIDVIVEVQQHLGDNRVRCVSMHPTDGMVRGMKAVDTGEPHHRSRRQSHPRPRPERHRRARGRAGPGRTPRSATPSTVPRPPSRSSPPRWRCSRPASRSSTSSSPTCAAARSASSAAPAWARPSSSWSSSTTSPRSTAGYSVFAGVGERTREGNDLWLEMQESGVVNIEEFENPRPPWSTAR